MDITPKCPEDAENTKETQTGAAFQEFVAFSVSSGVTYSFRNCQHLARRSSFAIGSTTSPGPNLWARQHFVLSGANAAPLTTSAPLRHAASSYQTYCWGSSRVHHSALPRAPLHALKSRTPLHHSVVSSIADLYGAACHGP